MAKKSVQVLMQEVVKQFGRSTNLRAKDLMDFSVYHYRAVRANGVQTKRGYWTVKLRDEKGHFLPAVG